MTDNTPRYRRSGGLTNKTVEFPPPVRAALVELVAATRGSQQFSPEMRDIIEEWATGEKSTVWGVILALPNIADDVNAHIHATGDKKMKAAWDEFKNQLLEHVVRLENQQAERTR